MVEFGVGKRYNFNTLAPVMLGSEFKNALVVEIMMAKKAITVSDIGTVNARVSQELSLPVTPNVNDMVFVLFETDSNDTVLLSTSWINNNTIALTQRENRTLQIDDVDVSMIPVINQALRALGITKIHTIF